MSEYRQPAKKLCQAFAGLSCASNQANEGDNGCTLRRCPWWFGLLLGGGVWVALLALAHSAGPIDEAVFWASLIAALPIGFGYLCRYILSGNEREVFEVRGARGVEGRILRRGRGSGGGPRRSRPSNPQASVSTL